MPTPRQIVNPDLTPEANKALSLRRAAKTAAKREKAEADEATAIRLAALAGASTREIAKVTNRNHATVARIINRTSPGDD